MGGLSYLDATNWRYDNWGIADLLSVTGTTLKNLPATKSVTGAAFYQTTRAKCFDLPTTDEVWMKFDVYFDGSNRWRAYNGGNNGITGLTAQTDGRLNFFSNDSNVTPNVNSNFSVLTKNQLQTVILHMVSGSTAGVIEAWVDGTKIHTYTGDVNHGEDFADIYLQSDGSGTFFSNVIISNSEILLSENAIVPFGVPAIKPEIYISWIPLGEIGLKPQIYATIIQAPIHEKISADLNRKISKPESISGDLQRKVGIGEKVSADVTRHVISTDTAVADTNRKLFVEEKISGDTLAKIVQSAQIHADTYRDVQSTEKIIGDTSRKIGITTIRGDLQRRVNVSTKTIGETRRQVANSEKISGDTFLQTARTEIAAGDTYRKVENPVPTVVRAKTQRTVGVREKISADTSRVFARREKVVADTLLQTTANEKVIADTMRGLREVIRADTSRKVTRTEKAVARTVIRVPHVLNYRLQSKPSMLKSAKKNPLATDNPLSLVNTFKDYGVTAINITLSEKTLSDDFTFDIASRSMEINEAVQGWLLDYPFSFFVEETSQTELVQSVKGRYNIDDLLYTQLFITTVEVDIENQTTEIHSENQISEINMGNQTSKFVRHIEKYRYGSTSYLYPTAIDIVMQIASYFGMIPVVRIEDFTPYNLSGDHRVTYADILHSCFNWTSRLPQRQINVFLRGGMLFCIQRGKELAVFDITNLQHSRPTINKKLIRSLWSNPKDKSQKTGEDGNEENSKENSAADNADPTIEYQVEIIPQPFSGTISFSDEGCSTTLRYEKGLLIYEKNHMENAKATTESSVSYDYIEIYPAGMTELEIAQAKGFDNKNQFYGDFYLAEKKSHTSSHTLENYAETEVIDTKPEYKDVVQSGSVIYRYGDTESNEIYLSSEYDKTTTKTYETDVSATNDSSRISISSPMVLTDVKTDVRETFHVPIGNGWYGQSVYLNGEAQGSNISQGKPGNKISQYTIEDVQATFSNSKLTITYTSPNSNSDDEQENEQENDGNDNNAEQEKEIYEDWRRKLAPIADTSFPVRELNLLKELTNDLLWLNRKIEETVTVDLTSKIVDGVPEINHIVDFTERILFNDAEYFLVSNKISFTPRKLIQKLQLIRWY